MQTNKNDFLTDLNLDTLKIRPTLYEKCPDSCLITLDGYLDTYTSSDFKAKIMNLFSAGFYKFIIDCQAVKYISSTGVGCFISILKEIRAESGDLVLLHVPEEVYQVIQILGFSKIIQKFENAEEVEAYFGLKHEQFSFPAVASCPSCGKKLKVSHAGRFRCTDCKNIFSVMENGDIILQKQA
ncbi:MAG: anti-sigma factor antagonist [Treponema sp.]|nr:anti-sigma factor antagonist [Treponema sp.]